MGYRAGDLTLTHREDAALKTDLGVMLAAAGARGTLVDGDGPKFDAVTDAHWVLTTTPRGLTISLHGRGVMTHETPCFQHRCIAGTLAWDPPPSTGRGPKLTPSQTIGPRVSGGKEALLSRDTLKGLAANDCDDRRQRRRAVRLWLLDVRQPVHGLAGDQARPVGGGPRLQPGLAPDPHRGSAAFARGAPARGRERRHPAGAWDRVHGDRAPVAGAANGAGPDGGGRSGESLRPVSRAVRAGTPASRFIIVFQL